MHQGTVPASANACSRRTQGLAPSRAGRIPPRSRDSAPGYEGASQGADRPIWRHRAPACRRCGNAQTGRADRGCRCRTQDRRGDRPAPAGNADGGSALLSSWDALQDYLRAAMANSPVEEVRVLFLNAKNMLIANEAMWRASVDEASMHVREVMMRAMAHGATAIIVVHNHPSGDPTPSQADVKLTRELVEAGRHMKNRARPCHRRPARSVGPARLGPM
jgi:proteasome lid subunit RPN8/RPN11